MHKLAELILNSEEVIFGHLITYATRSNYTKYTSTLKEAWLKSIRNISQSLIKATQIYNEIPELKCDEDYTCDPIAVYGISQAKLHLNRGIPIQMFLGLLKYYKQSYLDLLYQAGFNEETRVYYSRFLERCFDRIELGFISATCTGEKNRTVEDLQNTNRHIINEKNYFLTVFESLPNPVIVVNEEFKVINLNYAAIQLFENAECSPGKHYYFENYSVDVTSWLGNELFYFKQNELSEYSFSKASLEGTRWFEVKFSQTLDISSKFYGIFIILNDVTERKKAEEQSAWESTVNTAILQVQHKILSTRNLKEIASIILHTGKLLTNSQFGYVGYIDHKTGKFVFHEVSKEVWEICLPDEPEIAIEETGGLLGWGMANRKVVCANNLIIDPRSKGTPQGHSPIYRFLAAPVLVDDLLVGQVGLANSDRDYNENEINLIERLANLYGIALLRIQAEEQLRETNQKLNTLFATSPAATIIIDSNKVVERWNETAEKIFGWKSAEVIGVEYPLVPPDKKEEFEKIFNRVLNGEAISKAEIRRQRKDGTLIDVSLSSAPIRDSEGRVKGAMTIFEDISERKKAEEELKKQNQQMKLDLELAADVQRELLPKKFPSFTGVKFAWVFKPSIYVAGDMFNVFKFNEDNIGLYILDVKGHGIQAALNAVSLSYILKPTYLDENSGDLLSTGILSPSKVLARLNRRFYEEFSGANFVTILYGVLNLITREFTYATAGHRPPVLARAGRVKELTKGGPAVGLLKSATFSDYTFTLKKGDKILLYTDGVIEAENDNGEYFGLTNLMNSIQQNRTKPIADLTKLIINEIDSGNYKDKDDISILGFEMV